MKMENVLGVSERQIGDESSSQTAIIGPKRPWWVDYLPESNTLPMYDPGQSTSPDNGLTLKLDTTLHHGVGKKPEQESDDEGNNTLLLVFRDGLDQPIRRMEIKVGAGDSSTTTQKTDDLGTIQVSPQTKAGKLAVTVKDHDGREQKVCDIELARCRREVKIQSPKVVVSTQSRPHHAASPQGEGVSSSTPRNKENQPWYEVNGALGKSTGWLKSRLHRETVPVDRAGSGEAPHVVAETVSQTGNPSIVVVGPEVDTVNNLRLGEDNIYRELILKAAQRIKIVPHAVCGLLECEAGRRVERMPKKDKNGQPVLCTKGKRKGQPVIYRVTHEWDAKSFNASTNAAGLTQFLPLTWLDCILKPGYFISDESLSQKKPWIAEEKGKRVFIASNGDRYGTERLDRIFKSADSNVQACLEMRFDPEWSIMAAVDYAQENWRKLFSNKEISGLSKLTDGERIKIMYLLHHEGPGAGPDFILDTLAVRQNKFDSNVTNQDKWLGRTNNDMTQAYRLSLADYIDTRIVFSKFAYNVNAVETMTNLLDIFPKVTK